MIIQIVSFATTYQVFAKTISDDTIHDSGTGTAEDPYVDNVDALSKVSWKHLKTIGDQQIYEIYQIVENGVMQYSWYFSPEICQNPSISGPYFLGINKYFISEADNLPGGSSDEALYFSFALKRDLPGGVKIKLNVSDNFADGTVLALNYYGGYDGAAEHGDSPLILPGEIYTCSGAEAIASGLTVTDGYVEFDVRHGGNYYLKPESADNITINSDEVVLGKINDLFSGKIADAIAGYFGKTIEDTVTQGDLNSIKKLYLADRQLDSLDELSNYNFSGLEQLTASGNNLEKIPLLKVPQITYLDLSGNKIDDITGLDQMPTLKNILLSDNRITKVGDLSNFTKLTTLDLSNNKITSWDAGIKNDTLRYLKLSGNQIEKEIDTSGLTALEELEYAPAVSLGMSLGSVVIISLMLIAAIVTIKVYFVKK
ncbi:leucine-rich repeat domain-containing protein [Acetobacterium woodii]|uniref:Putative internalin like protein n=1 Tax=Acetobacterium woodii (strain ATCC 29683 / DSM 1030 / JCM 2381 / KCTC 1655 / WB1) TaxID=931626 RepID=H6LI95_ACEWD|nr:leucine-rich repeat domain-containing protein [Acetobacterium woodii]AFA47269.1 putative internalin like protein [Acetobacterium woodii DSM 1030]